MKLDLAAGNSETLYRSLVFHERHHDLSRARRILPPHQDEIFREDPGSDHALASHPQSEDFVGSPALDRDITFEILDRGREHSGLHPSEDGNEPGEPGSSGKRKLEPAGLTFSLRKSSFPDERFEVRARGLDRAEPESLLDFPDSGRPAFEKPFPHVLEDAGSRFSRRGRRHEGSIPDKCLVCQELTL